MQTWPFIMDTYRRLVNLPGVIYNIIHTQPYTVYSSIVRISKYDHTSECWDITAKLMGVNVVITHIYIYETNITTRYIQVDLIDANWRTCKFMDALFGTMFVIASTSIISKQCPHPIKATSLSPTPVPV